MSQCSCVRAPKEEKPIDEQNKQRLISFNKQTHQAHTAWNRTEEMYLSDDLDWECSDAKHKKNDSVRLSLSCDLQFAICNFEQ